MGNGDITKNIFAQIRISTANTESMMKCWQYGSRSIWLADRRALPISQIVWHFALEGCANEVLRLKWSQMKPSQKLWISLSLQFSPKGQRLENYSETDTTRVIQRILNNSMYFNATHATCRSVPSLNNSEWETSELISIQYETNIISERYLYIQFKL